MKALCVVVVLGSACGRIGFDPQSVRGVTTLAGSSEEGFVDGVGEQARFRNPVNLAVAPDGNVYVCDSGNSALRVVSPDGVVTTLVQSNPDLQAPFGILFGPDDTLYVSTDYGKILIVDRTTGALTVLAQGYFQVRGLALIGSGRLAFSDWGESKVRVLDLATMQVTLLAGAGGRGFMDGSGSTALFDMVTDLVVDDDGALLAADLLNHRIRRVALDGTVSTFAGAGGGGLLDGDRLVARFDGPVGLAKDAGTLYIGDRFSGAIRRLTPDGLVTTIAGTGVRGYTDADDPLAAMFYGLEGIDVTRDGRLLYIADGNGGDSMGYHRIRVLALD